MNQWKWLLISLGLAAAASVGLVACGEENEKKACTSNADCGDGEICISATGVCEAACETTEDCEGDDLCSLGCAGSTEGDFCFTPCTEDGDCSTDGSAFCDRTFCGNKGGLCTPNKTCTVDTDCANGKVCEPTPGATTSTCVDKCTEDKDCFAGSACNTTTGHCIAIGAACTVDEDCGAGNVCTANKCEPAPGDACTDQQTCYDRGNEYCAATGTGTNVCQDNSCGVSFNSCSRCVLGPNGGNRDAGGPEIFSATQNVIGTGGRNCKNDLTICAPDAPIACEFKFFAFSPTATDLPSTNLNKSVFVISSKGAASNPFGVARGSESGLDTFSFRACFTEGNTTPGTAAFLTSTSGKKSNTLCTIGTK